MDKKASHFRNSWFNEEDQTNQPGKWKKVSWEGGGDMSQED